MNALSPSLLPFYQDDGHAAQLHQELLETLLLPEEEIPYCLDDYLITCVKCYGTMTIINGKE
ncbi:MAG: hypothetical protein B2I17_00740 [Thermoplasmatales archaeon B_DKE]|nr:MAG: hypothetical protein B2I17_00740 [Thermoplasmatales archaeon B_DKE]